MGATQIWTEIEHKMTGEIIAVEPTHAVTERRPNFFELTPQAQVEQASQIAKVLSDVIRKQGLSVKIGSSTKEYVKAEGWQTLGTFLGILPRERETNRLSDGSYVAHVDLIKFSDGTVVGGGSALCSASEQRWGRADEFARRSMAITRATGKAYRGAFAWIITLAGYEPTPAEEMPTERTPPPKASSIYEGTTEQQNQIRAVLEKRGIPIELWDTVHQRMIGRLGKDLPKVLDEITNSQQ